MAQPDCGNHSNQPPAVCATFVKNEMEVHFPSSSLKKYGPNPNRLTSPLPVRRVIHPDGPINN